LRYIKIFAPTPNWTDSVAKSEWVNLFKHIRRAEWSDVHGDEPSDDVRLPDSKTQLSYKLQLAKTSKPPTEMLNEEMKAYSDIVTNKLHDISSLARHKYANRNNLNLDMCESLTKLKKLVQNRIIVVCRADKDGKILVLNYEDYQTIMTRELESFERLCITDKKMLIHINDIINRANLILQSFHTKSVITDNLFYHVTGQKKYGEMYQKVPGPMAKYFTNYELEYAYPLFKTHK